MFTRPGSNDIWPENFQQPWDFGVNFSLQVLANYSEFMRNLDDSEWLGDGLALDDSHIHPLYPLVNLQKAMENHHF